MLIRMAAWVTMLALMVGCAPTYRDLKHGALKHGNAYTFAEEECRSFQDDVSCRRFIAKACETLVKRQWSQADSLVSKGDFVGASVALGRRKMPLCAAGVDQNAPEVVLLAEVAECGRDKDCIARTLKHTRVSSTSPFIKKMMEQGLFKTCDARLEHALFYFSVAAHSTGEFSNLVGAFDDLGKVSNWCGDADINARVRPVMLKAMSNLADSPERSLHALVACDDAAQTASWSARTFIAEGCDQVRARARGHLDTWVETVLEQGGLKGADSSHFAAAISRLYESLSITSDTQRQLARQERPAATGVPITLKVRGPGYLKAELKKMQTELMRDLGRRIKWAMMYTGWGPKGPASHTVAVKVPGPMKVKRTETTSRDYARYISGHTDVMNPKYIKTKVQCNRMADEYAQCQQQYDIDLSTFRSCRAERTAINLERERVMGRRARARERRESRFQAERARVEREWAENERLASERAERRRSERARMRSESKRRAKRRAQRDRAESERGRQRQGRNRKANTQHDEEQARRRRRRERLRREQREREREWREEDQREQARLEEERNARERRKREWLDQLQAEQDAYEEEPFPVAPTCTEPTVCISDARLSACDLQLTLIPKWVKEPVWKRHPYTIRHVELNASLAVEIAIAGVAPRTLTEMMKFSVRDQQVTADRAHNVKGDPLTLPSERELLSKLLQQLRERLQVVVEEQHPRICARLLEDASSMAPHQRVARLMAAEQYHCGSKAPLIRQVVARAL